MKTVIALLALTALVWGENATSMIQQKERVENQVQNKIQAQNRFQTMSTDELLQHRGTLTSQQEREQLHNELMNRQATMTKEQKEKFMKRPENRTPKMKNQGEGQGMMQGKGMGGGMGKGNR